MSDLSHLPETFVMGATCAWWAFIPSMFTNLAFAIRTEPKTKRSKMNSKDIPIMSNRFATV